jgi:hypothetical protein
MKEPQFPQARLDCLARQFDSDLLIYDPERNVGHCLNSTAAAAWKLCDGSNSPSEIARTLARQLSAPIDKSVVLLALDQLAEAHLFVEPVVLAKRLSRRVAVRRIGIAATIALPVVTSILAPTPANAASCFPDGHPCLSAAQCCSHLCGLFSQTCGSILIKKR